MASFQIVAQLAEPGDSTADPSQTCLNDAVLRKNRGNGAGDRVALLNSLSSGSLPS